MDNPDQSLVQRMRNWWNRWLDQPARPLRRPPVETRAASTEPATAEPLPLTRSCTVVIPALNEAKRIAEVVRFALADPATAEVLVVDDSSIDDTVQLAREAGARVITSSMLGKGTSMRDGMLDARNELLVYLDGDLAGLRNGIISDLVRPLVQGEADFVKARFGRGGGRVTELTAKPMLKVFFPEVAHFAQPLGGVIAARRGLLQPLAFEDGYGVDIGLLLDAHRAGARLAEVDIGSLEHDSQPLLDLTVMANEVSRVIYQRARASGRLHVEQIIAMYETQRQATAELDHILTRRRGRQRVLLLDMDGTVSTQRFVVQIAAASGRQAELMQLLDQPSDDDATRSERIAALFRFVHKQDFEKVARSITLRPGVIEFVNRMRREGFMVGLLSDSYFVAADIVRKRIFADFALAHTLQFDNEVCNGTVRINPAFLPLNDSDGPPVCKSHVLRRMRADGRQPPIQESWAVGDNVNDLGLLRLVDRAFAIDPKSPLLAQTSGVTVVTSFDELLAQVPTAGAAQTTQAPQPTPATPATPAAQAA
ncbi:MAG: glycosyltransferase [Rubrivivax sp.]|nr:glycosyltransferase [Rubrivivax sp.]